MTESPEATAGAGVDAAVGEVLPHLHYCVTHDDLIRGQVVGRCCSSLYDGCLHNHPCDIRRMLVEAPAARSTEEDA